MGGAGGTGDAYWHTVHSASLRGCFTAYRPPTYGTLHLAVTLNVIAEQLARLECGMQVTVVTLSGATLQLSVPICQQGSSAPLTAQDLLGLVQQAQQEANQGGSQEAAAAAASEGQQQQSSPEPAARQG